MNEEQKVELKLIHMEEVVSKEVSWLWYPYIPYGKITVIEGDPGEGKTTLVLKLAAMLSKGLYCFLYAIISLDRGICQCRRGKEGNSSRQ